MVRLEIRPLSAGHVADAARLLAARHAAHRRAEPLLDPRYESVDEVAPLIADALAADDASGAVATSGGEVTGFLLGAPKPSATWGPNVWVESAGHAVHDPETIRDLYAVAAAGWVDAGRTAHYVLVPSHDEALVDAWFRLGFGQQHAHAVREAGPPPEPASTGVEIRRAERRDIPTLGALDLELPAHQGLSPVFSSGPTSTLEEAVEEWEESIDDPDYATFVAVVAGRVVGSAVGCSLEKSSLHSALNRPADAGFLGFAAVLPDARGAGAGRALGEAVRGWMVEAGYRVAATDWRVTNLLSSRTWPRLGYRTTFVRLHRVVGY